MIIILFNNSNGFFVENEVMMVSQQDKSDLVTVKDKSKINKVRDIIKNVKFQYDDSNKEFLVDLDNSEYEIRLVNKRKDEVIFIMWIWEDDNSDRFIIFNTSSGEYGYLDGEDMYNMLNIESVNNSVLLKKDYS
ncbi:MAG: hypothetical protein FH753_02000 [Firmicutes bacterium]|nr:hypothetical protein [Bacillota bacterium]